MTIKVITEPSVYLVGRQAVDEDELARFLSDEGVPDWQPDTPMDGETLVEVAGRLCYMSFARPRPGGSKAYIEHILDVGHGSVLEHEVFNLILTGVSRSFTHELVRHRAGFGFSQLSQRYVDESDVAFVVPPALMSEVQDYTDYDLARDFGRRLTSAEVAGGMWWNKCNEALREYSELADYLVLKLIRRHFPQDGVSTTDAAGLWMFHHKEQATKFRKQAREAARSVLPNCTETKIFVTGNARAWRHFVEMRSDPSADAEMRRVALAVLNVLRAASPNVFGDYVIDGDYVTTHHRKV